MGIQSPDVRFEGINFFRPASRQEHLQSLPRLFLFLSADGDQFLGLFKFLFGNQLLFDEEFVPFEVPAAELEPFIGLGDLGSGQCDLLDSRAGLQQVELRLFRVDLGARLAQFGAVIVV